MARKQYQRADRVAGARGVADKNRARVLREQQICGICGRPVDKSLKYPDPWAPVVDHIIPLHRGGSPLQYNNLQLAHAKCNRLKSDKLPNELLEKTKDYNPLDNIGVVEWSINWLEFKCDKSGANNSDTLRAQADELRLNGKRITNKGIKNI